MRAATSKSRRTSKKLPVRRKPRRNHEMKHLKLKKMTAAKAEMVRLGEEYRAAREEAGLSREAIREKTGISVSTVHHLEAGRSVGLAEYIILMEAIGYRLG